MTTLPLSCAGSLDLLEQSGPVQGLLYLLYSEDMHYIWCIRLQQGTNEVTLHEYQGTPSPVFRIAVAVFHFTFMSGIQKA